MHPRYHIPLAGILIPIVSFVFLLVFFPDIDRYTIDTFHGTFMLAWPLLASLIIFFTYPVYLFYKKRPMEASLIILVSMIMMVVIFRVLDSMLSPSNSAAIL